MSDERMFSIEWAKGYARRLLGVPDGVAAPDVDHAIEAAVQAGWRDPEWLAYLAKNELWAAKVNAHLGFKGEKE